MANRTTVKANINALNVPSVSNVDLGLMLNTNLADNLKFREDVALAQNSSVSNITVNFAGKDRIDLTRTGGSLNISTVNIGDGEEVILYIAKTAGQPVTFASYTDITPVKSNVTAASIVAYKLKRIGVYKICWALLETVKAATETNEGVVFKATQAECNALANLTKYVAPGNLPSASETQKGIVLQATAEEIVSGSGLSKFINPSNFLYYFNLWVNAFFNAKPASKILGHGYTDFNTILSTTEVVCGHTNWGVSYKIIFSIEAAGVFTWSSWEGYMGTIIDYSSASFRVFVTSSENNSTYLNRPLRIVWQAIAL